MPTTGKVMWEAAGVRDAVAILHNGWGRETGRLWQGEAIEDIHGVPEAWFWSHKLRQLH